MTDMHARSARARDVLDALGDTCDEIADTIRRRGIKGHRGSWCLCPIAQVLTIEVPDDIGRWEVTGLHAYHSQGCVRVPDVVEAFIGMFDESQYPDLIAGHL